MASRRLPLNLYLLKTGASPSSAIPAARVASIAEGAEADGTDELSPNQDVSDSGSWLRTWLLTDGEPLEQPLPDETGGQPSLLMRGLPSTNAWQSFLQAVVPGAAVGAAQENLGALLFQSIGSRTVVWSFGNAWSLIDLSATVERFGLRAGLNALLSSPPSSSSSPKRPVGVRGLTSAVRAAVVRRATLLAARPSSPTTMERVDQSSDAASMAELTTHHKTFGYISAGRSLRFEAVVRSLSDLESYATEALRLFDRKDYSNDVAYKWIDYTVPVGDRAEVDRVLDELLIGARAHPPAVVDMVWAEANVYTGLTPSFVCFPNERSTPTSAKRTEMTWASALTWLNGQMPNAPGRDALRSALRFYEAPGSPPEVVVELWELLVAQVAIGSDTYFVSDGDVWRASSQHILDINNMLTPYVVRNPPWLPRYVPGEDEASYNRRAASTMNHLLLDKTLVRLPSQTPFEPCDLLSHDGLLMHVKRKTGSATMSHVVTQALASTQLLRSDAEARRRLDEALKAYKPKLATLPSMRAHCASFASRSTATIDVVIIGSWRSGTPDVTELPLLTRISLNTWLRQTPCPGRVVLVGT